jgi:hypothetical protein
MPVQPFKPPGNLYANPNAAPPHDVDSKEPLAPVYTL